MFDMEATPATGLVPAFSTAAISITLRARAPGDIRTTCWVSIAGLETPFYIQLYACASGPKLNVEPKELQWGKVRNWLLHQLIGVRPKSENKLKPLIRLREPRKGALKSLVCHREHEKRLGPLPEHPMDVFCFPDHMP